MRPRRGSPDGFDRLLLLLLGIDAVILETGFGVEAGFEASFW
jgi:hypothetical protein